MHMLECVVSQHCIELDSKMLVDFMTIIRLYTCLDSKTVNDQKRNSIPYKKEH